MAWRIALFLLLLGGTAFSQEGSTPVEPGAPPEQGEVFAPFVSRLKAKAEPDGAGVVLSWRRSADLDSRARVYRHSAEIGAATFEEAEMIARLEPGQESFTDFPPSEGTWFYAVLLEDPQGEPYRLFIPFRNNISFGVAVSRTGSEEQLFSEVSGLEARADGTAVELRFTSSRPGRELLLFRGTEPMRAPEDLLAAVAPTVVPGGTSSWSDTPLPGVDYWYALVDAGRFRLGNAELAPGVNTTDRPVQVPIAAAPGVAAAAGPAAAGAAGPAAPGAGEASAAAAARQTTAAARPAPLPFLLIGSGIEGAGAPGAARLAPPTPFLIPDTRAKVRPETARAVGELLAALPPRARPPLAVQILPVDAAAEGGGEAAALKTILVERLQRGDHARAEQELGRYLSVHRPPEVEARARFYLAQARWFQGRPREALLDLLLARERHYLDVQPWLEACLYRLAEGSAPQAR